MAVNFDFTLAPKDAIKYLEDKGYQLSYNYDELVGEIHHRVFTVAKVTRLDLLQDIHSSLFAAQKSGVRFEDWLENIKPNLQKKGWWGEKEIIDKRTGEVRTVRIGSRRLKHIFRTNMRVAHSVQRYKKMRALTKAVYWRYISALKPTTRDDHSRLHGTTLHRDDPFWHTNYPPNDHGCLCKVRAYTEKELTARKITIDPQAPKDIAHPDWAYDVGAGSRVSALNKMELGKGLKTIKRNKALDKLTSEALTARFYQKAGSNDQGFLIDKVGDPIWLGKDVVRHVSSKRQRVYLDELASTIAEPDEMFVRAESLANGDTQIVKTLLRYVADQQGKPQAVSAAFTYAKDKTLVIGLDVVSGDEVIEQQRTGKLIYQREAE